MDWPDLVFPPVNLYSAPCWPPHYLELENEYCKIELSEFYTEKYGTLYKEVLRLAVKEKREEFNRLWNNRALGG